LSVKFWPWGQFRICCEVTKSHSLPSTRDLLLASHPKSEETPPMEMESQFSSQGSLRKTRKLTGGGASHRPHHHPEIPLVPKSPEPRVGKSNWQLQTMKSPPVVVMGAYPGAKRVPPPPDAPSSQFSWITEAGISHQSLSYIGPL
jgi:hypothetical protein